MSNLGLNFHKGNIFTKKPQIQPTKANTAEKMPALKQSPQADEISFGSRKETHKKLAPAALLAILGVAAGANGANAAQPEQPYIPQGNPVEYTQVAPQEQASLFRGIPSSQVAQKVVINDTGIPSNPAQKVVLNSGRDAVDPTTNQDFASSPAVKVNSYFSHTPTDTPPETLDETFASPSIGTGTPVSYEEQAVPAPVEASPAPVSQPVSPTAQAENPASPGNDIFNLSIDHSKATPIRLSASEPAPQPQVNNVEQAPTLQQASPSTNDVFRTAVDQHNAVNPTENNFIDSQPAQRVALRTVTEATPAEEATQTTSTGRFTTLIDENDYAGVRLINAFNADNNTQNALIYTAAPGTPVHAADNGTVEYMGNITHKGNTIVLEHTSAQGDTYYSVYSNLDESVFRNFRNNQVVEQWDVLGQVAPLEGKLLGFNSPEELSAATGLQQGESLTFIEIKDVNGNAIDPAVYIPQAGSAPKIGTAVLQSSITSPTESTTVTENVAPSTRRASEAPSVTPSVQATADSRVSTLGQFVHPVDVNEYAGARRVNYFAENDPFKDGIFYVTQPGTPIHASDGGQVVAIETNLETNTANVTIMHQKGDKIKYSEYDGLDPNTLAVQQDQIIGRWNVIGNAGTSTQGPLEQVLQPGESGIKFKVLNEFGQAQDPNAAFTWKY